MEIEPRQGIYLFCVGLEATQTNADFIQIHISGTFLIGRCWGGERARRVSLAEPAQLYLEGISSLQFSPNHPFYKNNR